MSLLRKLVAVAVILGVIGGLTITSSLRLDRQIDSVPVAGVADGRDISRLQQHLRAQPQDAGGWAALGLAYVEQARMTADPSYYPKAASAFGRSLRLQPRDNEAALTGQGALAAARHDFASALRLADAALRVNPYGTQANAVRIDALVELGRYSEAEQAVRSADRMRPDIPIFTRYAYVMELTGRSDEAERVLRRALSSATDSGDVAYLRTQLGELAWNRGDLDVAGREFAWALRVSPAWQAALDGHARVRAAQGDVSGALADRRALVARMPLPSYVVALGELYDAQEMTSQARSQYAVAGAWTRLAQANGVSVDLELALISADHGDRSVALRAARAEWAKRRSIHVADALAWALHVNGRSSEAYGYARQAVGTGYQNPLFHYHLGMIEKSLGKDRDARRSLAKALDLNPRFSERHAPSARKALADLS